MFIKHEPSVLVKTFQDVLWIGVFLIVTWTYFIRTFLPNLFPVLKKKFMNTFVYPLDNWKLHRLHKKLDKNKIYSEDTETPIELQYYWHVDKMIERYWNRDKVIADFICKGYGFPRWLVLYPEER